MYKYGLKNGFFGLMFFFLFSCNGEEEIQGGVLQVGGLGSSQLSEVLPPRLNLTSENTVCDPLGEAQGTTQNGLLGELYYSSQRYNKAIDYIENGIKVPVHLLLSHLNVPTRKFNLGFETQAGQLILNSNNEALYEDFALKMESTLALSSDQDAGFYEFAVLGDDGVSVYLDQEKIIDMDYLTSTKMGCDQRYFYFDHSTRAPLKIEYFQGPRYQIALIVLWRRVGLNEPSAKSFDQSCGRYGEHLWFDVNQTPSQPKAAYLDLLSRGWSVIQPESYILTEEVQDNPCDPDGDGNNGGLGGGPIGV